MTNIVTLLRLGIGIDYSLFILYRFREELQVPSNMVEAAICCMQSLMATIGMR